MLSNSVPQKTLSFKLHSDLKTDQITTFMEASVGVDLIYFQESYDVYPLT